MNNLSAQTAYVGSTEITQVRKGDRLVLAPGGDKLWYDSNEIPSLDLRFADRKDLVDAITGSNLINFTRASSATYVGSDGLIKTATTNEARFDHDPTTGESLGLLVEEQRSNLLLNSGTLATQGVTVTAVAHTLSFYGSGTVTLSGTHTATVVGTGAYPARTALTFTPTAGTLTVTVSGTVEYANLEIGSFATSYIPTEGSTVTRSADVVSITGSNFSSWYRQDEGTVFYEGQVLGSDQLNNKDMLGLSDGTSNEFAKMFIPSGNNQRFRVEVGGVTQVLQNAILTADVYSPVKAAFALKLNNTTCAGDGIVQSEDTSCLIPAVDRFVFGTPSTGESELAARYKRLTYWPQRLPDSTLETITE